MSYQVTTPPEPKPGRWWKWLLAGVGVVVSLIIVLVVVGLVVNAGSPPQPTLPTAPTDTGLVRLHYGQKATLSSPWTSDGIVSVTVYELQPSFASQTDNHPDAGDLYAVTSVRACAGGKGADTANVLYPFPFQLTVGRHAFGALDPANAAKEPDLGSKAGTLRPNECVRGYVTFQYARGQTPTAVAWGSPGQPSYEWTAVR